EQEEQDADHQLKDGQGNELERRPEEEDQENQQADPGGGPDQGGPPAADRADGEGGCQGFDEINERRQERSEDRRADVRPFAHNYRLLEYATLSIPRLPR